MKEKPFHKYCDFFSVNFVNVYILSLGGGARTKTSQALGMVLKPGRFPKSFNIIHYNFEACYFPSKKIFEREIFNSVVSVFSFS